MTNPCPRIAAIQDISGFGRASLNVAIPVLSTMGFQVCSVPTAVLTSHSEIEGFRMNDLTGFLPDYIEHWKELGLCFDAVYSGFLGSPDQIGMVEDFISAFHRDEQLVVVDPVLGDNGSLYPTVNQDLVEGMVRLVGQANVITPNVTEAGILLGKSAGGEFEPANLKSWLTGLAAMMEVHGARRVIITSVPADPAGERTAVAAYDSGDNKFWKVESRFLPVSYPGSGDAFASVVTGALLQGDSLPVAVERAVRFVSQGIRGTFGYPIDPLEGFLLERVLPNLQSPLQQYSFELF